MENQPILEFKSMGKTPGPSASRSASPASITAPPCTGTSSSRPPHPGQLLVASSLPAAPAPPWENPKHLFVENEYHVNYDISKSLPSHVSVDTVSKGDDDSSDGPSIASVPIEMLNQAVNFLPSFDLHATHAPIEPEPIPYPQRPGETVCDFYMKTGFCKFLEKCMFHHPVDRSAPDPVANCEPPQQPVTLTLAGLPRREDAETKPQSRKRKTGITVSPEAKRKHGRGTLVEFSKEEEANSVMEKKLSFAGANPEINPKKEFDTERYAKQQAYGISNTTKNGYPKCLILAFKLKKILTGGSAEQPVTSPEEKVPENADVREEKSDDVEESNAADAQSLIKDGKSPLEKNKESITREDLKEYFAKFGTLLYVDFAKGDDSGYLRFEESKATEKACALAALSGEGGLIMKGHLVTLKPVSESSHKDRLQKFSLKKYQKYPVYTTRSEGEPHDCKFWCAIEVDGQHFKSRHLHVHKKEAEQDAAMAAYEFLMARDGDNFADVFALIDKDLLLWKTILYEFSSKKKTGQPIYSFNRQKSSARMTVFTATVTVEGKEFPGDIAKNKKAAAEKAACLAVKSILDTNDEYMLRTFRSKRSVTATLSKKRPFKKTSGLHPSEEQDMLRTGAETLQRNAFRDLSSDAERGDHSMIFNASRQLEGPRDEEVKDAEEEE